MNKINKIEIKNFKKFRHLDIDDIGEFNLITGDNNVGKTSLLEAIVIIQDNINTSLEYLHRTLCVKNFHIHPQAINSKNPRFPSESYFTFIKNVSNKPIEFIWYENNQKHSIGFQDFLIDELAETDFQKQKPDNYNINNTKFWIKIFKDDALAELQWMYLDDFKRNLKYGYWELISFNAGFESDVNRFYIENIGIDNDVTIDSNYYTSNQLEFRFKTLDFEQKKTFLNTLSLFVSDIEDTSIKNYYGRDMLSIKTKSYNDYQPITFWGEGFNKYVRYLLEIIQCKGKKILIDEIDTGVHWSKLESLWVNIMKSCKLNDVQLFATTHNLDCIKAFTEAAEKLNYSDDIRLVELKEANVKGENKIYSNTYAANHIEAALISDVNIRGGKIYGEY